MAARRSSGRAPQDEREGALARPVAETVDAWLRDPRDGALYMRLLIAVEAWRACRAPGATAQLAIAVDDLVDQVEERGESTTMTPAELAAGIPPFVARLRRLQAEAHAREHPDEGNNDRQEGDGEEPDVASPAAAGPIVTHPSMRGRISIVVVTARVQDRENR